MLYLLPLSAFLKLRFNPDLQVELENFMMILVSAQLVLLWRVYGLSSTSDTLNY